MARAKVLGLAGAAALLSTSTFAADLPPPLPPPVVAPMPVAAAASGWYLRGDVGVGMQKFNNFQFTQTNPAPFVVWPSDWQIQVHDIKDTTIIGFGIGYQWCNWLRFDFTGERRSDVKVKALGTYTNFNNQFFPSLTPLASDHYDLDHSAVVALANVYFDLGTWWCLTPFVGAGVGAAWHRTAAITDVGLNTNGFGASAFGWSSSKDFTETKFAWAAHAGLAFNVTNNFKLEFSYRYLHLGDVRTPEVNCDPTGVCNNAISGPRAYYTLTNLSSQDFRIGFRYLLQPDVAPPPAYAPPPALMRKG
jgi:opacity protein-like surface antigen